MYPLYYDFNSANTKMRKCVRCNYKGKDSENLLQRLHNTNYNKRNMCVIPHIGHTGFAPVPQQQASHWI